MKPSARIQTVITLLEAIEKSSIPMDLVCGDYFRTRRYIGSKDRSFIANLVYAIKRTHARIQWWLGHLNAECTPRNQMIVYLHFFDERSVTSLFDGTQYAPDKLSDDEQSILDALGKYNDIQDGPDMTEQAICECPENHYSRLKDYFAGNFRTEMQALIPEATLDLRINTLLANKEKVMAYLEADGVKTSETPYSPFGLRCLDKVYLSKTKAFAKGWIEIQDEGAQLIALLCDVKAGEQVLDYCAGAGGKTLALAAMMECKGRIVAMDIHEDRLMKSKSRLKKAHAHDIVELRAISDARHKRWLKRQKDKFDCVLIDVPCSGTGTWRRNPDMRWKQYGPSIEQLIDIQREILSDTAKFVKPGGRLVYATCSILSDENENQIAWFLDNHPDFTLKPIKDVWPENLEVPSQDDVLRLTPHRNKTDGFFAAYLVRSA